MLIFLYMNFSAHSILLDRFMMTYLLTEIGLTPGGSSAVHIHLQTIRKQHNKTEYTEQNKHNNKNT